MLSRVLSLTGNHSPPTLPRMFSNTLLADHCTWYGNSSDSNLDLYVFLLNCPQLSEPVYFPLWEVSVTF